MKLDPTGPVFNGGKFLRNLTWVLLLISSCLIGSARAEMIIVSATGTEEFRPGEKLDPAEAISLPDGVRITILSKNGDMQVVTGPHEGPPVKDRKTTETGQSFPQWEMVSSIFGQTDKRSEIFGVTRNLDGNIPPSPKVWHVSVDSSGPRCMQPSGLTFWRRNADNTQKISIRSASGTLKDISWPSGEDTLAIPGTFPVAEGRMIVSIDGELRDLELHAVPDTLSDGAPGILLGWLMEKKCNRQALALIEHVHTGTKPD